MLYLMCSTPRVGSSLLSTMLSATGVTGDPNEYLNRETFVQWTREEWGFESREDVERDVNRLLGLLQKEYRVGEWFGMKTHFDQFKWAFDNGLDLRAHFPDRVLYLTRADILGQAISLVRAVQTGAWNHSKQEKVEPEYSAKQISDMVRMLTEQNAAWESFFQQAEIEPLRIGYETFCADMESEFQAVLRFLDVDPCTVDTKGIVAQATSKLRPQRDGISAEWRQLYREHLREEAARRCVAIRPDAVAS